MAGLGTPPVPATGEVATVPLAPAAPDGSDEVRTVAPPVPALLDTAASPAPPTPELTTGTPPVAETWIAPSARVSLPPAPAVPRSPSSPPPVPDGIPHDLTAGQVGAVAMQVRRESMGAPEEEENQELDHEDDNAQSQGHTQDHDQDDDKDDEEEDEPPRQEFTQASRGGLLPLLDPELELDARPEVHLARKFWQAAWQESPDPLPGPAKPAEASTSTTPVSIALATPIHFLTRFSMNDLQRRKSMYCCFCGPASAPPAQQARPRTEVTGAPAVRAAARDGQRPRKLMSQLIAGRMVPSLCTRPVLGCQVEPTT